MDIQFQTPFCCRCCTGSEAIQQYAPRIEGIYKCSRCGYIFDVPTGKFIFKNGFEDEFDFKSRISELEKEVSDRPNSINTPVGSGACYDSAADTLMHIKRVNELLIRFSKDLMYRAICHDNSKLREPEKADFDRLTPILKELKYGSPEYKASLAELQVALKHHYEHNSHHPEHYENGVDGMDLLDLVEMFMDWKAATERTKDGSISKSIEFNKDRFKMSEQLVSIFKNTVRNYGW